MNNTIKMNNTRNDLSAHWTDESESKKSFDVKMKDGTLKTFQQGTWMILPGRNDKVIIDSIISPFHNKVEKEMLLEQYGDGDGNNNEIDVGPRGITYLPWRYDEKRFATMSFTMRGNARFIICYPVGIRHFGGHIDWDLVEITSPPDNIDQALVEKVLERMND